MKLKLLSSLILTSVIILTISLAAQEKKRLDPPWDLNNIKPGQLYNFPGMYNFKNPSLNNFLWGTAENGFWSSDFGLPGTDQFAAYSYVQAIAATQDDIYIGGNFRYAQDSLVNRIAKLDGSRFCSVGGGTNGPVYVLKAAGNNLYVGGSFDTAGTVRARNIAMWDGSEWHALGAGVDGIVMSIETSGSNVFAAGDFDSAGIAPARNIAVWNGSVWNPLGEGTNNTIYALKITGSDLYLGGNFDTAGTMNVNHIAKWNGSGYDSLSSGTDGIVKTIEADGAAIYAGGVFVKAGGIDAYNVAKWESNTWSNVGSGVDGEVNDMVLYSGNLYIGGMFQNVGILPANGAAMWDGLQWTPLGEGVDVSIIGISGGILTLNFIDGYLFAGGMFDRAGTISANNIAYWDGLEWRAVGLAPVIGGANFLVYTAVMHNGELYAGGAFTRIGNIAANGIAKWNGSAWTEIGGGIRSSIGLPVVTSIIFSGNNIYICGQFDKAGDVNVRNIAMWNGSEWSALGNGLNGAAYDIKMIGGSIFAGGTFDTAGFVPARSIARWNGSAWSGLGMGLNGAVRGILPVGSDLYAAGSFITSGSDTVNRIAKWDGFSWSKLGKGLNGEGIKLYHDNGILYACGSFTEAGDTSVDFIAAWNGSTWAPAAEGLSYSLGGGGVSGLIIVDGKMYAGGAFDRADSLPVNNVALYEGNSWQPLGEGLGGYLGMCYSSSLVYRGTADYDIYFSGLFSLAGGKASYNVAKYSVTQVDVDEKGVQIPKEFSLKQNYPNPFNPSTKIKYSVPKTSQISIKIFDVLGNEIRVLVNEIKQAGEYEIELNAAGLSSGVYFYQLKAGSFIHTKKMMLVK